MSIVRTENILPGKGAQRGAENLDSSKRIFAGELYARDEMARLRFFRQGKDLRRRRLRNARYDHGANQMAQLR